jgi:tetratricopeptide (TPR) repeat protein
MSRTLNFCEHLLSEGRKYHSLGVDDRAERILTKLARCREIPAYVAEESQSLLAEILLQQGKFAKVRRHLTAALAHDRSNACYHHMMAVALEEDPSGDRDRALSHYRRCIQLEPEEPVYHCDAGMFAVKQGAIDEGLAYLRRAVELAPDDVDIVADVVHGLQEAAHHDEARQIARAALFHNNHDPSFRRLWNDVRFQELHNQQQRTAKERLVRAAVAEDRICLPFERLTVETPEGRKLLRRDGPSRPPAPHWPRIARLSDKKHA